MKRIKNNITLLTLIIILFVAQSCEKALDITSPALITKERVLNNETNARALLNSIYTVLASGSWNSGRVQQLNDLLGDQFYAGGGVLNAFNLQVYTRTTDIFNSDNNSFFAEPYVAIQRCNQIIENANIIGTDFRDNAIGQAKTIRAWAHFDLVRLYAQPYGYTTDNSHSGIGLRTSAKVEVTIRATVKQIYDQIIADLQDAEVKLPSTNGVYLTKWAAKALLAKVYFQQNNFPLAYQYANEVITQGKNVRGGNLTLDANFSTRFSVSGSNEAIFEVVNEAGNIDPRSKAYRDRYLSTGSPQMRVNRAFYNIAVSNANDQRKTAWYDPGTSTDYAFLKKFDTDRFRINLLHLTEMKLIRAEAGAEINTAASLAVAIADINDIRNRAYNNTVAPLTNVSSNIAIRDVIRYERNLELIGEGNRTQDLKRQGAKGENITIRNAPWNCPGMILQFPESEIQLNPNFPGNPEGGCQ